MVLGRRKRAGRRPRRRRLRGATLKFLAILGTIAVLTAVGFGYSAHRDLKHRLEGRLWSDPTTVLSSELVLRPGTDVHPEAVVRRLLRSGYGRVDGEASRTGQFRVAGPRLELFLRPARIGGQGTPSAWRSVVFGSSGVLGITDRGGRPVAEVVLEPEIIARLYGERLEEREVVPFERFPDSFVHAVLAAEDARFFEHWGFDPLSVIRAAIANLREGRVVQGGSTISQQTVKNLFLGHERTLARKLRELPMAVLLDLEYDKERILEFYLNEVYFGQRGSVSICGAQSAARFYFGRGVDELSVAEQALLAGIIRSPGSYNPFVQPERALLRRDQVLDAMVERGWLSASHAEAARREGLHLGSGRGGYRGAGYLVDAVRAELSARFGEGALDREGLTVVTSVDTLIQETAEQALASGLARLETHSKEVRRQLAERALQGAVVALDPASGAVLALVGGRDYSATQFNRVLQARRQPGSCFKPFVFLAAFEDSRRVLATSVTPATRLEDEPFEMWSGGELWKPENYDRTFRGPVRARVALEDSLNVPTIRVARQVGLRSVVRTARECGIESPLHAYASLALGAQEVTPYELARAYATLASGGVRHDLHVVREVRDADGRRLPSKDAEPKRVASEAAVFLVNDILRGVLDRGTAQRTRALGYFGHAAGKTGTTDDTRDSWFVGYSPTFLVLTWVGYDDGTRTGLTGAAGAMPIWVDIAQVGFPRFGDPGFKAPNGVVQRTIDANTGELAVPECPEKFDEWFIAGTEPDELCIEHGSPLRRWFRDLLHRDSRSPVRVPLASTDDDGAHAP